MPGFQCLPGKRAIYSKLGYIYPTQMIYFSLLPSNTYTTDHSQSTSRYPSYPLLLQ
jgi:hypothetical protein